jgi:predicted SAM-dependent methyltransferase
MGWQDSPVAEHVIHTTMAAVKRPQQRRRLQRALAGARAAGQVNISIGSGLVDLPGFITTDIVWWAPRYLDIGRPWPMPAGSVNAVYGDNVIEHLPLPAARLALRNALAALRPGGAIRLATPDAEATARAYLDDDDLAERHLDRHRRHGFDVDHRVDLLRITYTLHGHERGYIYDETSLTAELLRAGFGQVRRHLAGQSDLEVFRGLERRSEASECQTELILEAVRPGG